MIFSVLLEAIKDYTCM